MSARRQALSALLFGANVVAATAQTVTLVGNFTGTTMDSGWSVGGSGYTPTLTAPSIDTAGNGWLRLTTAAGNQSTYAVNTNSFISKNATITAAFNYVSYGGTGADGITFFLADASVPFAVGAYGGSLGYAQKTLAGGGGADIAGMAGGYIGLGIDEFGNYSNPTEGRIGGVGLAQDAVAVRGPGSGLTGYDYLGGTGVLPFSLDNPGSGTRPTATTFQIIITATNQLTVYMDRGATGNFTTLYSIDLSGYARPDTLVMGFTGSTGGSTNIHEVRAVNLSSVVANLWTNASGDSLWGTNNSWWGDPSGQVPLNHADVLLDNTYVSTAQTIDVGTNRTLRSLQIDAPFTYTLNNGTLTFDRGGITGPSGIFVSQTRGSATQTINSALALNNDIQVQNNSAGALNLGGAVSLGNRTLEFNGSGATNSTGVVSGTGRLVQSGTGTTTLSGNNTYSGGTTISAGTLNANSNTALGNGTVTLAGGTLGSTNGRTVANTLTLTGNAGLSGITTSGALTQSGGNHTLRMSGATQSGAVNLSNNSTARTLTVQVDSGNSTISGVIANGGGSTGSGLTKTGVGTLVLSGANTYTGTTTISGGTLALGASNVLADTSSLNIAGGTLALGGYSDRVGNLTFSNGATLDFGASSGNNSFVFGNLSPSPTGVLTITNYSGPDSSNFAGAGDFLGSTTSGLSSTLLDQIYFSGYGTGSLQNTTATDAGNGLGNAFRIAPKAIDWSGYTWISNSNQQWGTNANWSGGVAPPNTANPTNVFVNFGTGTQAAVSANASSTINALRFSSAAIGYTISGNSTLTFQNGTGVTFVQQQSANSQVLSPANIVIRNNMVFDVTGAGNLTVGGAITDGNSTFSVTKAGTGGTLILTQANTYDGGTSIQSGALQAQNSSALGTGAVTIFDGAALNLAGNISPTNAITVTGAGVGGNGALRNVSGNNTLSGTITETAATRVQSDAGLLTLSGNLTGNATATTFAGSGNTTVSGTITTGAGSVTKEGTGTLTLSGTAANTYTGTTTVNAGTLNLSKTANVNSVRGELVVNAGTVNQTTSGQLLNTGTVTLNGGTYNLDGAGSVAQTLQTLDTATGSTVNLGAADTLTISGTGISTINGQITGTGALATAGTGTVYLGGNNTYSGGTTIDSVATAANNNALGTGAVTVTSGGNLQVQGGVTIANAMTISGPGTNANDGALENFSGNNQLTGNLTLAAASRIQSSSGTLTVAGNIAGSGQNLTFGGSSNTVVSGLIATGTGGVTKDGTGTATFSGSNANTYTGTTTVSAGTLNLSKTAGVTSVAGNLAISGGTVNQTTSGQLATSSGVTLTSGSYNLGSSVTQTVSSLATSSGTTINLGASSTLALGGTGNNTLAGSITGTGGFTHSGTGTTTLSGNNTYTGATTITAGSVQLGASNRLADTSSLNLAGGSLDLAGFSEKVGDLTFSGGGSLNLGSAAGNNSFVFDGISPAATGVLTINNYSGPTVASATDAAFANAGDFVGSTSLLTSDQVGQIYFSGYGLASLQNTTLRDAGNGLGNAYRLAPTAGDNFNGYIWTSDGTNANSQEWNRNQNWSANAPPNTAGLNNVFVQFGTGTQGTVNFNSSATINALRFTGSTSYNISGANTLTFDNTANNAVAYIQQQSGQNQTLAPTNIALRSNLVVDTTGNGTLAINSAIAGNGTSNNFSLTKTGAGTLTLGGSTANTYTGTTTVNAGTLNLSKTANVNSVAGDLVVNGGTVNQTTSGQIAGTRNVTVNSGTYSLAGAGNISQSIQTLNTGSAGTVNIGSTDTLTIAGSGNSTLAGALTGNGTLAKTGSGLLAVNGASAGYSGSLNLSGGTTRLGVTNAFSNSSITVQTGAVLDLNGYSQMITNLQAGAGGNAGGSLEFGGATLTLSSGTSSFGGDFGTSAGTIVVNAGATLTLTDAFNASNINIVLNGGTLNLGNGLSHTFGNLTINDVGTSVLDFGTSGATSVTVTNVNVGGNLSITNWTNAVDYFISQNSPGTQGTSPINKIVFAGFSGNATSWRPFHGNPPGQITPVPEPSTYGALLLFASATLVLHRRGRCRVRSQD